MFKTFRTYKNKQESLWKIKFLLSGMQSLDKENKITISLNINLLAKKLQWQSPKFKQSVYLMMKMQKILNSNCSKQFNLFQAH